MPRNVVSVSRFSPSNASEPFVRESSPWVVSHGLWFSLPGPVGLRATMEPVVLWPDKPQPAGSPRADKRTQLCTFVLSATGDALCTSSSAWCQAMPPVNHRASYHNRSSFPPYVWRCNGSRYTHVFVAILFVIRKAPVSCSVFVNFFPK